MNKKQSEKRINKISKNILELRKKMWPEVDEGKLWNRKTQTGFTTIPRTMPLIMRIMDDLSNGKPLSSTYLTLWCRVFDESVVTINNTKELAYESGFSGQRAEATWKSRMKILNQLGFIDIKPGASGEYQYILLLNPYKIIDKYQKKKEVGEADFNALYSRAQVIGADDLEN